MEFHVGPKGARDYGLGFIGFRGSNQQVSIDRRIKLPSERNSAIYQAGLWICTRRVGPGRGRA